MKKNLAHDLNTLTRVYMYVEDLRAGFAEEYTVADDVREAIVALDMVLCRLNRMMDENWGELEQRYIFNDPSEIYREPDETSAVAFDGNELPF